MTEPTEHLATAYRQLEGAICDLADMSELAILAKETTGDRAQELVGFCVNQIDDLSRSLRDRYYSAFGEARS